MRTKDAIHAALSAAILLAGAPAAPAQIVLNLNETTIPFPLACNEIWTDSDIDLKFVPTLAEDACPGFCSFEPTPTAVALTGRLIADLSEVPGIIVSVAVDVEPFCAPGCTRAYLYEGAALIDSTSNPTSPDYQTLTVHAGANLVDEFAVSGCETFVYEIRITLLQPNGVEIVTLPGGFEVGAAAPNPFVSETDVSFRIVDDAAVRVSIYDVRGVRVRGLLERTLAAGTHVTSWDGRTDGGARAPAGVYFYEVRAGEDVGRRKVVRVR